MTRPNILLLTIDTLRYDRVGGNNGQASLTPNLDRLAERGIRFTQAITGGSWTQAAFPTILTSTYASMYGGCLGPLSLERPSPVEALSEHGYTTAGFSTSPLLGRAYGYQRGFQHFQELVPDERDPWLRRIKGGQRLLRRSWTHHVLGALGQSVRPARLYVPAHEVNKVVENWLNTVQTPFFAWIHYMDVHWPYHLEETLTDARDIAQAWKDLVHLHSVNWRGQPMSSAQHQHYVTLYEQAVQYVDAQVGELLQVLQKCGIANNTVIIVVSDHGEEFLERGHWGHVESNLHDEIIHVPLIVRLPESDVGVVVSEQVRTLDIMPTVLDLCKCAPLEKMDGESLAPLWYKEINPSESRLAISERWRNQGDVSHKIAVRTETHKFIWDSGRPEKAELYDLCLDPEEKHNVRTLYSEIVEELHPHVLKHIERAAPYDVPASGPRPILDEAVEERLRGLGYLG